MGKIEIDISLKIKMNKIKCYLCASKRLKIIKTKLRHEIKRNVLECQECGLVFLEPKKMNLKEYYDGEYRKIYSSSINKSLTSKEIFDMHLPFQQKKIEKIKHLLKPGMKVLEIGCSAGHFLYAIKENVKECVGIDFNKSDAKFVNEKLGIKTYTQPIENTDLQKNSFDLIFLYFVLEHIEDPINFLNKVSEYLKPIGRLIVQVPNIQDPLLSIYNSQSYADFWFREPHIYYFSPSTFSKILEKAGFSGNVFLTQEYGFINHMNWILKGKPQQDITVGLSEPILINSNLINKQIKEDFNRWIQKVNKKYLLLLNKHRLGENLLFIGKKIPS